MAAMNPDRPAPPLHHSSGQLAPPADALLDASRAYVYRVSLVAALGGLLFGYDTAIINGAIVFLKRHFALSDVQTEVAASSLLLGCVVGASLAGALGDWLGRRKLLLAAAAIFAVSAVATALPRNLVELCLARLAAGVAIGIASMLAPLYIAEVSPAAIRGRLVSLNQFAIISGILISYLAGWLLSHLGEESWRWMFLSAVLPSLLFFFALFTVPESPRWLVKEGRESEALRVLERLGGDGAAAARLQEIRSAISQESGSIRELFQPSLRRPLVIGLMLAILQQVTGINTILYYGSIIFTEQVGARSTSAALWANVVIGFVNLVGTVIALYVIDKLGRKSLLMIASGGMGVSLILLGAVFFVRPSAGSAVLAMILCYVGFFAVGMGPGVWVLLSELFPTRIRARAMSIATVSLWIACMVISLTFLSLVSAISAAGAFWVYAAMCVFTFFFVWRVTPETKGKTLEQIERSWFR
jgi:sugar porter (SP) family MFS transporter